MNYWLVDSTNLSECFQPLYEFIESLQVPGAKTAKVHYNAKGWVVHTISNVWGFTSPGESPSWGLFPTAGAWLMQHLWEHYAFTGDREFLKRAYPIMKESVEFYPGLARRRSQDRQTGFRPGQLAGKRLHRSRRKKRQHQHGADHGPGNHLGFADQLFGSLENPGH